MSCIKNIRFFGSGARKTKPAVFSETSEEKAQELCKKVPPYKPKTNQRGQNTKQKKWHAYIAAERKKGNVIHIVKRGEIPKKFRYFSSAAGSSPDGSYSDHRLLNSITGFFGGDDHIPWCDRDTISACEREVAEITDGNLSDEKKNESIMRLSWALVHSKQAVGVQRGIAMLEVVLADSNTQLQKKGKIYLLAVGYYRSGEYPKSKQLADQCLEIAPDWRQTLTLKKTVEDQIRSLKMVLFELSSLQLLWDW